MDKKNVKDIAQEILPKALNGYLATIDSKGFPHIRSFDNLRNTEKFVHPSKVINELDKNFLTVYISTNTSSEKIKQIKKNNNVAIYYCLPGEYKGIMLQGQIEIFNDIEFKKKIWEDWWTKYYPKGYTDPDFTILRLKPKYLKAWHGGIYEEILSEKK